MATVMQMHGLRGASLEAFRKAGDIIEQAMKPVERLYPRINLRFCDRCRGRGCNRELPCPMCAGSGTLVTSES